MHVHVHMCIKTLDVIYVYYVIVGIIPKSWNRYTVPVGLTVIQWVMDFSERIKQLQKVSDQVRASGIAVLKVMLHGKYTDYYNSKHFRPYTFGWGDCLLQRLISPPADNVLPKLTCGHLRNCTYRFVIY